MLNHKDIPKLIDGAHYRVDTPLGNLKNHVERYMEMGLDLDPDFQRGHVWNQQTKVLWMEFLLKGGKSQDLLFNHPGWMGSFKGAFVIVDGKQRLQACLEFLDDKFPVLKGINGKPEGWLCSEMEPSCLSVCLGSGINMLKTRKEVLQWYLELNQGHVAHTSEEITKVQKLLEDA